MTDAPLSLERLAALVGRPAAGAIVTFQGTTRTVEQLEYEAYREMAEERIGAIVADAVERHDAHPMLCRGCLEAVASSAAHREEAFAGAREIIDRIKAEAPIWKKEVDAGSERWVAGTPPGADGRPR